ncbi:hypothetical protein GCM10010988_00910 [Cnuibacter physcomitrellae]|nr:hypothetical protein GCM10010988_00910 [Cnuibacter physcomitrellae]
MAQSGATRVAPAQRALIPPERDNAVLAGRNPQTAALASAERRHPNLSRARKGGFTPVGVADAATAQSGATRVTPAQRALTPPERDNAVLGGRNPQAAAFASAERRRPDHSRPGRGGFTPIDGGAGHPRAGRRHFALRHALWGRILATRRRSRM